MFLVSQAPQTTLVIGGARSGKSHYAEQLVMASPPPRCYVATPEPFDDEMTARMAEHRNRRGDKWQTVEASLDLVAALQALPACAAVLVDCLTLWVSNLILANRDVDTEMQRLEQALLARTAPVV